MLWLLRKFRKYAWVDWFLTRAESYTALLDQYPYLRLAIRAAVAAVLAGWTWFAESWLPVGIAVGIVVFASLTMMEHSRSLMSSAISLTSNVASLRHPPVVISDDVSSENDRYAIDKIRLLCISGLDPASDALRNINNDQVGQMAITHPDCDNLLERYGELVARLTKRPREQLQDLLRVDRDGTYNLGQQEAARALKEYLEGYVKAIRLLMDHADVRELIKRSDYAEWRVRHRALSRMHAEFSKDKQLELVNTTVGCTGLGFVDADGLTPDRL